MPLSPFRRLAHDRQEFRPARSTAPDGPGGTKDQGPGAAKGCTSYIFYVTNLSLEERKVTQIIRLGPQETRLLFSLEAKKMSVFAFGDARDILEGTDSAVWNVVEGLKRKGRLREIESGKYLLVPARAGPEGHWSEDPWLIVPRLIDRYYVGFWTAMSFWDMTEQIPYTVFVVTPKRKRNRILKFGSQKFQFVTVSERKFFGYVEHKIGRDSCFNISSKEKTIVDGLAHPEYCGGITEVIKAMWNVRKEADWDQAHGLAKKIGVNVVLRRLGYLLTVLDIEQSLSEKIKKEIARYPYSFLDPTAAKTGVARSKEFGLVLNRTEDELFGWM